MLVFMQIINTTKLVIITEGIITMRVLSDFVLVPKTTENFFDSFTQELLSSFVTMVFEEVFKVNEGIFLAVRDKQGEFQSCDPILNAESVILPENAELIDGIVTIIGDETDYLYVKFVV
jgi:hypothetical protein